MYRCILSGFTMFLVALFAVPLCAQQGATAEKTAKDQALSISYIFSVDLDEPGRKNGDYVIEMHLDGLPSGSFEVAIPAWKPGSYRLLRSHERIREVAAHADGKPLKVVPSGKRNWRIEGEHRGQAVVRYRGQTQRSLEHWMSLEGPETWLYLVGGLKAPCRVSFRLPEDWLVACGMTIEDKKNVFSAPDFDTFADCPVELGKLRIHEFQVDGITYYLTYNMAPIFEHASMQTMCEKLIKTQTALFGEVPWDRYYFMWHLHNKGNGSGGLEHLNSTTLQIPQFVMRKTVETMADLVSHELFHAWNVKRIRPEPLGPFDYSGPVRVKSLWWAEGVTDYYAARLCYDSGIWNRLRFLGEMRREINSLISNRVYGQESIEDASWKIWDRNYYQSSGRLDYYNYGKVIGFLLDIEIRHATKGKKSLDDVMRDLNSRFALPKPGFKDIDLIEACSAAAGKDLSGFFSKYISGKEAIPFSRHLAKAGIDVDITRTPRRDRNRIARMMPGVVVEAREEGDEEIFVVTSVPESCPFSVGDRFLKFGRKVPRSLRGKSTFIGFNANRNGNQVKVPEDRLIVLVQRGDQEVEVPLALAFRDRVKTELSFVEPADAASKAVSKSLFSRE